MTYTQALTDDALLAMIGHRGVHAALTESWPGEYIMRTRKPESA
jgi:hypothetical protein